MQLYRTLLSLKKQQCVMEAVRLVQMKQPHLVTHVQCEEQDQHASGGVAAVVLRPALMDVLEERRVIDLHLVQQS